MPNKRKPFRAALVRALARAGTDPEQLDVIADVLQAQARGGELPAIRELADRLDGKPPQTIAGDDDADPVTVRTIITGVPRPDDDAE